MNEFKTYHPIVNFIYFVFVIGFSMFFMHPICLAISLICAFTYLVMIGGKGKIKFNLIYILPMIIGMALVNPAFNHGGVTILGYLPSGNPLTLESITYGLAAGIMLASVICWFACYNQIMTSDKFIYLFGRIIPAMSLIISMILRFVPRFASQLKVVANAQRGIGRDMSNGSIIKRAKSGLNILSIMITWSLENALETADSMKSRGYGLPGRTAFSIYRFDNRDKKALIVILCLGIYILIGSIMGGMYFSFIPRMISVEFSIFSLSMFVAYLGLCICPIVIEIWEVRKWNVLRSRM